MPSLTIPPRILYATLSVSSVLLACSSGALAQSKGPAPSSRLPIDSLSAVTKYLSKLRHEPSGVLRRVRRAEKEAPRHDKDKARRPRAGREEREERGGWLDAYQFFLKQRAYPGDKVNWSAIRKGAVQRDRMPAARMRPVSSTPSNGFSSAGWSRLFGTAAATPTPTWEFVGPRNLKNALRWAGLNPVSGRVNAIAYSPDKSIYVGSSSGGVFKSTGGLSWTPLSNGWPTLAVSSIAVDPTNPNKVYVGTGDFQGYQVYPFGLMRSVDGGKTWINAGQNQFDTSCISQISVDPESPNIVTLTAGFGVDFFGYVWRSTDSGATWSKAFDSPNVWSGLTVSKRDSGGNRAYYAVGLGEIQRSLDRGATWTPLTLPTGAFLGSPPDIAASQVDPRTVYLFSPYDEKVYRSSDLGGTWTDISSNLSASADFGQYFYDYHIHVAPFVDRRGITRDSIYVGLIDLHQSVDGGLSWRSVGLAYTNNAILHPDQHTMAINPANPAEGLIGGDGGLYRLFYNGKKDLTTITADTNQTLGITEFYHGSFHPFDPSRMLGGAQDNSTPAAFGNLSDWGNVGGGDGGFAEIHPLAPNIQYATSQYGTVYQTLDNWRSSSYLFGPSGLTYFIAPIAIDPEDPDVLYQGTETVWKYSNRTRQWRPLAPILSQFDAISFIAVSPSNGQVIYAGSGAGELFKTADGGKTWREIDQGNPSLPSRFVTSIAVNPDDPNRVVVALSGTGASHVWQCADTSAANPVWVDAGAGLPDVPANTVAIDGVDPANTWYVGTDVGAFITQNGGSSWSNMTQSLGLPNVRVDELRVTLGTGYLNAATYGRGMWRIKVANPIAPVSKLGTIPGSPRASKPFTLVVTMLSPAPTGGQAVTLQSSNPTVIPVPSKVTVVAGFNILQVPLTAGKVTAKTTVTISASAGGKTRTLNVSIVP